MPVLLWLIGPIGRYVVILAVAGAAFLWVKVHYENIGYQKALDAIAAQDKKAKGRADEAHQSVQKCFDSGGTWDITRGVCAK